MKIQISRSPSMSKIINLGYLCSKKKTGLIKERSRLAPDVLLVC